MDGRNQPLRVPLAFLTLKKNCRQDAIVGQLSPLKGRPVDLGFLDVVLTLKGYEQVNGSRGKDEWGH